MSATGYLSKQGLGPACFSADAMRLAISSSRPSESVSLLSGRHLASAEAQFRFERFFPVPTAAVRSQLSSGGALGGDTSDRIRPRTPYLPRLGIKRLIHWGGARGTPLGSETHCYHGANRDDLTILRMVRLDREPGVIRSTLHVIGRRAGYYVTQRLREEPSGSRLELPFLWEAGAAERPSVPEDFAALVEDLGRLAVALHHAQRPGLP